ncbi:DUF721 domain-containing protein [Aristophania vespae]|uniref:DUF721 domain-containing protein n=1 Tax=Aristophania vespae TaxID=2697033 RepID=A0A6P1NHB6_9PROT|nr:DciA family protein [Aristophania vespae]QHI96267.1 DUF721 domain-containing protein [Aristophania vespae]UMM64073.1 hypothetical protein DM15PD_10560 [Aristophania vespae]
MSYQGRGRKRANSAQSGFTPPKRSYGVRSIGSYVPNLTRPAFQKKSPLFTRLVLDWEQFVGKTLFQISTPKRLHNNVLTVSCYGPQAIELQYNAVQILGRINVACGLRDTQKLVQLKIVQDRTLYQPIKKRVHRPIEPQPVPDVAEGSLREALERLGGHIKARTKRSY